jgi:hypothetical protein
MELSMFAYICMVAWLPCLPAPFWDRVERVAAWAGRLLGLGRLRERAAALRGGRRPVDRPSPDMAWPVQIFAAAAALYMLAWNIDTVSRFDLPGRLKWFGEEMYLGQKWAMFSPRPPHQDGFWIAPARLADGTEIDLFSGGPVVRERPPTLEAFLPTMRWNKYLENVRREHKDKVSYLADWLRWRWETAHDTTRRVVSLEILYLLETTEPDYAPPLGGVRTVYRWKADDGQAPDPVARQSRTGS